MRYCFSAVRNPFCHVRSRCFMHACRIAAIALAILVLTRAAPAAVLVTIDKSTQRMMVQVDGSLRWVWPISTGRPGHDTPSGRYTAFRMEADHFSKEWDDAPMPHSIFFSPTGHAIHGYLDTHRIGTPASHGCVRLNPANAARLYELVEKEGLPNTKVVVTGDVRNALARRGMWRHHADDEGLGEDAPYDDSFHGYGPRSWSSPAASTWRAAPSTGYGTRNWGYFRPFGY
jgi:L,D-transpeptidase catalytic domain